MNAAETSPLAPLSPDYTVRNALLRLAGIWLAVDCSVLAGMLYSIINPRSDQAVFALISFTFGVVAAQIMAISLWVVAGIGSFASRCLLAACFVTLLCLALLASPTLVNGDQHFVQVQEIATCLAALALAQLPLFTLAFAFLRIAGTRFRDRNQATDVASPRLSISGMFQLTTAAALIMTVITTLLRSEIRFWDSFILMPAGVLICVLALAGWLVIGAALFRHRFVALVLILGCSVLLLNFFFWSFDRRFFAEISGSLWQTAITDFFLLVPPVTLALSIEFLHWHGIELGRPRKPLASPPVAENV